MGGWDLKTRERLREIYKPLMPVLKSGERISPYTIWPHDWPRYMSPIEKEYWAYLRATGQLSYYPQVPCGPYFIDFASPSTMKAIELDGAEWHTDVAKDARRQRFIEAQGYKVTRISGSDVYRLELPEDDDEPLDKELEDAGYAQ